jgi:hypothetical protein
VDIQKANADFGVHFIMEIDESVKTIDDVMLDIMTLVNKSPDLTSGFSVVYKEIGDKRFFVLSQKPVQDFDEYMSAYLAL